MITPIGEQPRRSDILEQPISVLSLKYPFTSVVLADYQITTVGQLVQCSACQLDSLHNIGPVARRDIDNALAHHSLALVPDGTRIQEQLLERLGLGIRQTARLRYSRYRINSVGQLAQCTLEELAPLNVDVAAIERTLAKHGLALAAKRTDLRAAPIGILGLRGSFANSLQRAKIDTVGQLVERSPLELLDVPNVGKVCLRAIQTALAAHDLALRPNRRRYTEPASDGMRDLWHRAFAGLAACYERYPDPAEACVRSLNKGSLAWELTARLPTEDERVAVRRWARVTLLRLVLLERVLNGSHTVVGTRRGELLAVPFDWSTAPPDWMNPEPPAS